MLASGPEGWVPIRIDAHPSEPIVDWAYLGRRRFSEPFFDRTIANLFRHPFPLLFRRRSPLDNLAGEPELEPKGFIFHLSRCGSTLLSQMLSTLPENVVLSEPPPIDTALRSPGIDEARRITWLQGLVSELGRRRNPGESRLFIKFDSWLTSDLPLIRRAFPQVPWVFLYRDPFDVMVSQFRHRGAHMVPGLIDPARFGIDATMIRALSPEEYGSRVLAATCQSALESLELGGGMLLEYGQLPGAAWAELAEHFGVAFTAAECDRMYLRARLDAKNPILPFDDHAGMAAQKATDALRRAVDQWARPHYERLEAIRLTGRLTCV